MLDADLGSSSMGKQSAAGWAAFAAWLGESLAYAMGQPSDPAVHPAPLLGFQPYHDKPIRHQRRWST